MPATKGWSRRFGEPIELPDGRKLRTLKEAIAWLAKEIPKSEHTLACCDAASAPSGRVVSRTPVVVSPPPACAC
jgi:hypothetical protein